MCPMLPQKDEWMRNPAVLSCGGEFKWWTVSLLPPCGRDHTSLPLHNSNFLFLHPQPSSFLKGRQKGSRISIISRVIKLFRVHCRDTRDKSRQDSQYWKCGGSDGCLQHANQWKPAQRTAVVPVTHSMAFRKQTTVLNNTQTQGFIWLGFKLHVKQSSAPHPFNTQ